MPKAKFVFLTCSEYEVSGDFMPFEIATLDGLRLICDENCWTMDELKAVFSFFPNLTYLQLELGGLASDFDEPVTIKTIKSCFLTFTFNGDKFSLSSFITK
jgi:hypothetical protein